MTGKSTYMDCTHSNKDCIANKRGVCIALSDTHFENKNGTPRECPFYKSTGGKHEEKCTKAAS